MNPHSVNEREEELDVFFGVINRFIGYFTRDSQRLSENDTAREYPFVAMDTRQAYEELKLARDYLREQGDFKPGGLSFLDIGCGIGNVMLLAELLDFSVHGIEKDQVPFQIAQKLLGEELVAQDDIWDFSSYHDFDLIYYFRPFSDGELQRRFEKMVEDRLKPGGILIANRKMDDGIESDPRFSRLSARWPVWVKEG
ncbi:MAG: class I SAM-dependent methyltransferase [Thermodesulfobacteriota bacterium]